MDSLSLRPPEAGKLNQLALPLSEARIIRQSVDSLVIQINNPHNSGRILYGRGGTFSVSSVIDVIIDGNPEQVTLAMSGLRIELPAESPFNIDSPSGEAQIDLGTITHDDMHNVTGELSSHWDINPDLATENLRRRLVVKKVRSLLPADNPFSIIQKNAPSFETEIVPLRTKIDAIDTQLIAELRKIHGLMRGKSIGREELREYVHEEDVRKPYAYIVDQIRELFAGKPRHMAVSEKLNQEDGLRLGERMSQLYSLLDSRFDVVRAVGELKLRFERPTLDASRWEAVLENRSTQWGEGGAQIVPGIWNAIHEVALDIERDVRDYFRGLSIRDSISGDITITDASHPVLRGHFGATEGVDDKSYPLVPGVYLKRLAFAEYQKNYGTKKISELTIHFHGMILPGDILRWDSERLGFTRVGGDKSILVELKEETPSGISEAPLLGDEESAGMTRISDRDLDAHLPQKPPFRFPYAYKEIPSDTIQSPNKEFMMSMVTSGHSVGVEVLEEFAGQALTYHYSHSTQEGYRAAKGSIGTFSHGWTDFNQEAIDSLTPGTTIYLKGSYEQVGEREFTLTYSLHTQDGTLGRGSISGTKMGWRIFERGYTGEVKKRLPKAE